MKNLLRISIAAVGLMAVASGLLAQPAVSVVTVDLKRLFENYYKTEAQNTKLQATAKQYEDQINVQKKELDEKGKAAQEALDQSKNAALSEDARKKAEEDAKARIEDYRRADAALREFVGQAQQMMGQTRANFQQQTIEDIRKVAADIAKKKGATLLLDKSDAIPVVLYADPGFDITEEVLAAINKDRPVSSVNAPADTPAIKIDPAVTK